MSRKQIIEITVETEQVLVIRNRGAPVWCEQCGAPVERLTAHQAAAIACAGLPSIFRGAEEGSLHSLKAEDEELSICLNSLLNVITQGETL